MLKRTFTYKDFNGTERTEEHMFALNESEIIKWITTSGDYSLDRLLQRLADERNGKKIMEIFEELIRLSYGKISLDGRKFMKSQEIWEDFYQTEAYSMLFMELVTDAKKAADFINSIIPQDLAKKISKVMNEQSMQPMLMAGA